MKILSHQRNQKILGGYLIYTYLLDDIVVDDGWSIPSTFLQQTAKQLEVIWKVV